MGTDPIFLICGSGRLVAHGDEFLRHRGMDADGGVELRLGGAELHGDGDALDHFAGVGADHVRADDALAFRVDDELHERPILALGERELERTEVGLVDVDHAVALARLFLAQSHGCEVGMREHCGRYVVVVDRRRLAAKERAREPHRLGGGDRREVDAVGDVADGVDGIHARFGILVDQDRAIGPELHARGFEPEVRRVRPAPGGEEHQVRLLVRAVGVADLEAVGVFDDLRRLAAEVDLEALVAHLVGDPVAHLGVEAAQQALAAVREHRLDAEAVEDGSALERDVAAADHQRSLRKPLEVERFVRGNGALAPFDRRDDRPRARGDEDVPRAVFLALHFDRVRIEDRRPRAMDLDAGDVEDALVDRVEARDLLVLVGEKRRPVELGLTGGPAIRLRDLEFFAPMRGVGEKLLRDAADVDAGAAEAARLGDRHLRAIGRADAARAHAAGAGAYGEEVEIEAAYFRFFRFSSTSSSSVAMRLCCGLSASHFSAFFTRVSICAFGMPSTPVNIDARSTRLADCAALRTPASLPSTAGRSRFVTIFTVLSSDMSLRSAYLTVGDCTSAYRSSNERTRSSAASFSRCAVSERAATRWMRDGTSSYTRGNNSSMDAGPMRVRARSTLSSRARRCAISRRSSFFGAPTR